MSSTRLVLRAFAPGDLEPLLATIDGEVLEWQGWDDRALASFTATFPASVGVRSHAGCPLNLVVLDAEADDEVIGQYSLQLRPGEAPHLGWWLGPRGRSRGLGTESLGLMLSYVHEHLKMRSVVMGTAERNERASRQMRANGCREVGVSDHVLPKGETVRSRWFVHEA